MPISCNLSLVSLVNRCFKPLRPTEEKVFFLFTFLSAQLSEPAIMQNWFQWLIWLDILMPVSFRVPCSLADLDLCLVIQQHIPPVFNYCSTKELYSTYLFSYMYLPTALMAFSLCQQGQTHSSSNYTQYQLKSLLLEHVSCWSNYISVNVKENYKKRREYK